MAYRPAIARFVPFSWFFFSVTYGLSIALLYDDLPHKNGLEVLAATSEK